MSGLLISLAGCPPKLWSAARKRSVVSVISVFAKTCGIASKRRCFIAGEVIAYQVGIVPSRFYLVLGNKDKEGFYWTFLEASLYILASAVVSAVKNLVNQC